MKIVLKPEAYGKFEDPQSNVKYEYQVTHSRFYRTRFVSFKINGIRVEIAKSKVLDRDETTTVAMHSGGFFSEKTISYKTDDTKDLPEPLKAEVEKALTLLEERRVEKAKQKEAQRKKIEGIFLQQIGV
jgi:hypothetical protein